MQSLRVSSRKREWSVYASRSQDRRDAGTGSDWQRSSSLTSDSTSPYDGAFEEKYMGSQHSQTRSRQLLLVAVAVVGAAGAWAVQAQTPPSRQMREQMAAAHEKMAACLRSDKDIAVCRSEMHQSCQAMMGAQGCPMMEMGMGGRGQMKQPPPEKPDAN
jgi:hypothetical protein